MKAILDWKTRTKSRIYSRSTNQISKLRSLNDYFGDPFETNPDNEIMTVSIVDIADKVNHDITYQTLVEDIDELFKYIRRDSDSITPVRKQIVRCSRDIRGQERSTNNLKGQLKRMKSEACTALRDLDLFRRKLRDK